MAAPEASEKASERRRSLPSVGDVLRWPEMEGLQLSHASRKWLVRRALESLRTRISKDETTPTSEEIAQAVRHELALYRHGGIRRVVNATGVLLHTNLGRAPLSPRAVERLREIAGGYASLEWDRESGRRGSRGAHVSRLLQMLTGAESALVVNNNAAAMILALRVLAAGREVVVSRGELVEIGGSFRIPEILETAGVRLREVGTTNRTHLRDYESAIGPQTAALLKVHPSNFQMSGFCESVETPDLVRLGNEKQIPVMEDLGSGCLVNLADLTNRKVRAETTVEEALGAGVDCLTFSGDKLLGGPQAGIVLCKANLGERLRRDPLYRAIRPSKLDLAALEATLESYAEGSEQDEIPVLRALTQPEDVVKARAERLLAQLRSLGVEVKLERLIGEVGGGALPAMGLASYGLRVQWRDLSTEHLAEQLRCGQPAVAGRIQGDHLFLDCRSIQNEEEEDVVLAFSRLNQKGEKRD